LFTTPCTPPPCADLATWFKRHGALAKRYEYGADVAIAAGFISDRLGYAFASGYQAAARALVPDLPVDQIVALAATEERGNHPRAIMCGLRPSGSDGFFLQGRKTFVTLGGSAEVLLVVARAGTSRDGRPALKLVRLDVKRQGVQIAATAGVPFAPEIPHAAAEFIDVRVAASEVLEGDGYDRYLKPFRTVEDCYVHAALLGYLMQIARRGGWPQSIRDELVMLTVTMRSLCAADPTDASIHVAVGASLMQIRQLIRRLGARHWERIDEDSRKRWERDRPLLDVAGKARAERSKKAHERLGLT